MDRILGQRVPLAVVVASLLSVGLAIMVWLDFFYQPAYNFEVFLPQKDLPPQLLEFWSLPVMANLDFFNQVERRFIDDKRDFVEANLSSMQLTVYKNGARVMAVPILAKGKKGSWWETPAGIYNVKTKEKNHFSSFGGVYMPYSMDFEGNFFIHGWPYYQDGSAVASSYSGGCIRLGTDEAKEVFDLVNVGTPVLVFESFPERATSSPAYALSVPGVTAKSYLAADLQNNFVFISRKAEGQLPIASIVKLMTALVAVERINIEDLLTVTSSTLVATSYPRLREGQQISLFNLLLLLLQESSNEAANVIAQHLGGSKFINLMNKKAQAIGMTSTEFADPAGVEAANVSTAQDIFTLVKYLYYNRSFILKLTAGNKDKLDLVYGPPAFPDLKNFNDILSDPSFVGGKVGKSESAQETIVAVFETKLQGDKDPLAIIALSSENYVDDAKKILSWVKENFSGQE